MKTEGQYSVETGESPAVRLEVSGDLRVGGWDKLEVAANTDDPGKVLSVDESEEAIRIDCRGDLRLWVPRDSRLELAVARGDVHLGGLAGPTTVGQVAGDLSVRGVGDLSVASVSGDLSVRDVEGGLKVGAVAADASVKNVAGDVVLEGVGADLFLRGVGGSVQAKVGADALLSLAPKPQQTYRIQAGADIRCGLADDADARFEAQSGAGSVRADLEDATVDDDGGGSFVVTVGEGDSTVTLIAGGSIAIVGVTGDGLDVADIGEQFASEFSGMADGIAMQVQASTEAALAQVSEHLASLSETLPEILESAGLAGAEADRIAEKVRASSDQLAARAAERAVRRAERAARHAERKAAKAHRRAELKHRHDVSRHRAAAAARPRSAPPRPREPVTNAERQAILRMLEEGSITAEQAEALLRALGGQG